VAPSKANVECIWALEQLRAWGFDANLYFVGGTNPYVKHLRGVVRVAELEPFVYFMKGNASEHTYRDYLVAADIGIQLRTHRLGGLSGALLDAIIAGMPVVVNADLAAAMDAPDYVDSVPDQISPVLVAEQIEGLVAAGKHRVRVSAERTKYVERHSFSLYAQQLMVALGLEVQSGASDAW
jgi:glycosyltransferase involved in cell wall biosynthesis